MGMYTGIRFKGVVKPEFRKDFRDIAMGGMWEESNDERFKEYSTIDRYSFIPCGALAYMPDSWEEDYINDNGARELEFGEYFRKVATDGFERQYNENTGYWAFQCSLKNYSDTIEYFFELIPYFVESIEHLEYFYEEWRYSTKYELINGKVLATDINFIDYRL